MSEFWFLVGKYMVVSMSAAIGVGLGVVVFVGISGILED